MGILIGLSLQVVNVMAAPKPKGSHMPGGHEASCMIIIDIAPAALRAESIESLVTQAVTSDCFYCVRAALSRLNGKLERLPSEQWADQRGAIIAGMHECIQKWRGSEDIISFCLAIGRRVAATVQ